MALCRQYVVNCHGGGILVYMQEEDDKKQLRDGGVTGTFLNYIKLN